MQTDIAVIGAGPAGMAAAVAAAERGARVALLDAGDRPGGQYFRHGKGKFDRQQRLARRYFELRQRMAAQQAAGRITYLSRTSVISLQPVAAGFEIRARKGEREQSAVQITAVQLILATGAHDRVLPFQGWDLPGSYSVGAAQALAKGSGSLVGKRIVLGGSGPFLLATASTLIDYGANVVALAEANSLLGLAGEPAALRTGADKFWQGAGLFRKLLAHGVQLHQHARVVRAIGADRVGAVEVQLPGRTVSYECDAVATGWGFLPQLELAEQLDLALSVGDFGELRVEVDEAQGASRTGVFAAGESTGVSGVDGALVEGEIAGAVAAGAGLDSLQSELRRRQRQHDFAALLARHYPVPNQWWNGLADDVVMCRCEEVTCGDLRVALATGVDNLRSAKVFTRAGMGWCQGRMCAANCAEFLNRDGALSALDALRPSARRPIATPIPLSLLAEWDERLA